MSDVGWEDVGLPAEALAQAGCEMWIDGGRKGATLFFAYPPTI